MNYKFNRDCWVESFADKLLGGEKSQHGKENSSLGFRIGGFRIPQNRSQELTRPSPIEKIISGAKDAFAEWSERLKRDLRICHLLERLEANLKNSRQSMLDLGIVNACALCDEREPEGSCCSRGLEKKYTPMLLLINLLLGASLPESRQRVDSCFFLGLEGCVLKARHMLCVDYLCPELEESLGRTSLIKIQTISGEEIESAFLLQEAIREKMMLLMRYSR